MRYLILALLLAGCSQAPTPPTAATTTTAPEPAQTVAASTPAAAGHPGKAAYDGTCLACHGEDGKGVEGLGKPLVGSPMMQKTDDELVAFVNKGREPGDPENTTGIAMPPKGGNPALTDAEIKQIVEYIRTLK